MRVRSLGVLLCALLLAVTAFAQEQSGSIQGVVKDSQGAVLPGATVEARNQATGAVTTAVADGRGMYRFPALPPGRYDVTATLSGFTPAKTPNVVLALGQLLAIDNELKIATVTETVEVTGEAPLIDVKQNASFATVDRSMIDKIPTGRDFTSVVSVAPGTNNEAYAGGIQIDGASGSENRFIVDGMDTTSMRSGTSSKTVLVDFLQEVQVKSSGYNAEFGGSTGGVINVISKAGTNTYHGSATTYYTGNLGRGQIRDTWRVNPWTDDGGQFPGELEKVFGRDNNKWNNWNPVGDFGGPLMRDRLWFYGGGSQNKNDYSRTLKYMYSDPVGLQKTFDWYERQRYLNWNLSTQASSNFRVKLSGAHQWNKSRGSAPAFERQGSTFKGLTGAQAALNGQSTSGGWTSEPYYSDQQFKENYELTGSDYTNQLFSANVDWVLTPTFFVNATAGSLWYNTTQPKNFATPNSRLIYSSSNLSYLPGVLPQNLRHASGWTDYARTTNLTSRAYYARTFLNMNTIWYKSLAGQHTFKVGMRLEHLDNQMNDGEQYPRFNIYWNSTRRTSDGRRIRGTYGYYRARQIVTNGEATSNNYSFWAQDSWTIKNRLTINAGLRTEKEVVPSYSGGAGIEFSFKDKLAPRLGFAYDFKGDGKWKAYGSFGWFYDVMKLALPIMSFGGEKWQDWYYTLDTYDLSQLKCTDQWNGKCGPGTVIEGVDYRFNSSIVDPRLSDYFGGKSHNTIDSPLKPYKTNELTLGLDHELNPSTSVGVRYVRKRLIYAIEDVGVKLPGSATNPSGLEVYFIANPGYGVTQVLLPDFPQFKTPKPRRDYDSVEFRLRKRLAQDWSINASYLWSRLYGNYSGLASSDEGGRTDPNVSRYFDAPYMSWTASGQPNEGPLYTDRPHQVKVQATYDFRFGTSVGVNATFQSGMPVGALVDWQGYPVFISTRDSLGRTPFQQRYDLYAQHNIRLFKTHSINLSINIDNVFDLKTITDYNQTINRDSLAHDDATFFKGFDPFALIRADQADGTDIRFNPLVVDPATGKFNTRPYSFMGRRALRFMAKYSF